MAMITLTTDFGWSDYYVGAMKGVIYQIAPESRVVDITHDIPAHDILGGALVLREIWRTFPPGTIHVGVVDPDVGSERAIVLAQYANQFFLVPDNGLITLIHQMYLPSQVNLVTNRNLFCQPVLPTFHGRDIFAPVAAHLAKGMKPDQVGPRTELICLVDIPVAHPNEQGVLVGSVIHIDRFGNLVTNISPEQLRFHANAGWDTDVYFNGMAIGPIQKTFSDVQPDELVAYIGSAGLLEIAVNRGRAEVVLNARITSRVEVR
jgi:hypothetical protein